MSAIKFMFMFWMGSNEFDTSDATQNNEIEIFYGNSDDSQSHEKSTLHKLGILLTQFKEFVWSFAM